MKDTDIAWSADKELYKKLDPKVYPYGSVVPPMYWREKYPVYNETFPYPDLHTDEAFQVWMRTAGLPTFSKLSRRNDELAMEVGRYEVKVYDCECFLLSTLRKAARSTPEPSAATESKF
jgi:hypothetical protein